jgi:hypothetical protein
MRTCIDKFAERVVKAFFPCIALLFGVENVFDVLFEHPAKSSA